MFELVMRVEGRVREVGLVTQGTLVVPALLFLLRSTLGPLLVLRVCILSGVVLFGVLFLHKFLVLSIVLN